MKIAPRKVTSYLHDVDYSFPDFMPSDEAIEFTNFIKLVNDGDGDENETPVVHLKMMTDVFNREKRNAILCHRGIAKTTVFAEYLFLYIAAFGKFPGFGKIDLCLYVTDSIENGVKNLRRNVEHRYRNSEFLRRIIPDISMQTSEDDGDSWEARYDEDGNYIPKAGAKFTDVRLEFVNIQGHKFVVKGYGAKTGVRGAKEMGIRPQLAVMDDIMSDEDARSDTVIGTIENTVHKAVAKALHPTVQKRIWIGTPFNERDPLYKAIESGTWTATVYPIAEEFNATTTKENFNGSWPDRFPYEYVKDEYDSAQAMGRPEDFDQELMLRVTSKDTQMINVAAIPWFKRSQVLSKKEDYNFYITTDLATSESKHADYGVISVWAINNAGNKMWVDGVMKKQLLDKHLDDLFRFAQIYRPLEVGVEVDGQQAGHIAYINERMITTNIFFPLASTNNSGKAGIRSAGSNTNKFQRFKPMQPEFARNNIWFPEEYKAEDIMVEFMSELSGVTHTGFTSRRDDCLDTITQLQFLNIIAPSVDNTFKYDSHDGVYTEVILGESEEEGNPYTW